MCLQFCVLSLGLHFEIPFIFNGKLLFMNYVIKIIASRYPSLHACGWKAGAQNPKINDDKVRADNSDNSCHFKLLTLVLLVSQDLLTHDLTAKIDVLVKRIQLLFVSFHLCVIVCVLFRLIWRKSRERSYVLA